MRELTEADDGVGTGDVWPLGVALGRALVCADAAVEDSVAAAAMVAESSMIDMQSSSRVVTSMSWQIWARMRIHARAGARIVVMKSRTKWQ